jgi:hypothetical protein
LPQSSHSQILSIGTHLLTHSFLRHFFFHGVADDEWGIIGAQKALELKRANAESDRPNAATIKKIGVSVPLKPIDVELAVPFFTAQGLTSPEEVVIVRVPSFVHTPLQAHSVAASTSSSPSATIFSLLLVATFPTGAMRIWDATSK